MIDFDSIVKTMSSVCVVFYLLFRDTTEGGNCERFTLNDTCGVDHMCSFQNFEAWMTMVHFTMGEFDVREKKRMKFYLHKINFHLI